MSSEQTVEEKRPLSTVEGKQLEAHLLAAKDDDTISFEEMSRVAGGFDYSGRGGHHHILQRVLARLRDEHRVGYEAVRGVGYRRLPGPAMIEKANKRHGKIARQADLGLRETVVADRGELSEEGRRKYDANVHLFGVHKLFSKPETVLKTGQVATNKPLPMKMDEEFLKSMS